MKRIKALAIVFWTLLCGTVSAHAQATAFPPHNGGTSQVNMPMTYYNGLFPFVNFVKNASAWYSSVNTGNPGVIESISIFDSDGYVKKLGTRRPSIGISFPSWDEEPTDWVIDFEGNARVVFDSKAPQFGQFSATCPTNCYGRFSIYGPAFNGPSVQSLPDPTKPSGYYGRMVVHADTPYTKKVYAAYLGLLSQDDNNHMRHLRMYRLKDEADVNACDAGEYTRCFYPPFIAKLEEGRFGTIRFLDWMNGNASMVARWQDRLLLTHYTWNPGDFGTWYPANDAGTALKQGAANTYLATKPGFALMPGAVVHVKFDRGATITSITNIQVGQPGGTTVITAPGHSLAVGMNVEFFIGGGDLRGYVGGKTWERLRSGKPVTVTSVSGDDITLDWDTSPSVCRHPCSWSVPGAIWQRVTLNVNGTGDVPVGTIACTPPDYFSTAVPSGTNPNYGTAMYNSAVNRWCLNYAATANRATGLATEVPAEIIIGLCNRLRAHCQFTSNIYATDMQDPSADANRRFATYVKNYLNPNLHPYFSAGNELWNMPSLYSRYTEARGYEIYGAKAGFGYWVEMQGRLASVYGQEISAIYGGDRKKYSVSVSQQSQGITVYPNQVLESAQYVAQGGSAAKNWVDGVEISSYFWSPLTTTYQELRAAWTWNASSGAMKQAAIDDYLGTQANGQGIWNKTATGLFSQDLYNVVRYNQSWGKVTQTYRSNGYNIYCIGYEGGYNDSNDGTRSTSFAPSAISSANAASATITTSADNPFVAGMPVLVTGINGIVGMNGAFLIDQTNVGGNPNVAKIRNLDGSAVSATGTYASGGQVIYNTLSVSTTVIGADAVNATITTTGTVAPFAVGNVVTTRDIGGIAGLNGTFLVQQINVDGKPNVTKLQRLDATPLNASGTYSSGGTVSYSVTIPLALATGGQNAVFHTVAPNVLKPGMIVRINPPGYSFPGVGNWMVDQTNVGGDPTAFTIIHGDGRGPIVTEGPQKSYGTVTFGNADDYVQWFRKYTRYGATMYDAVKYYYEAFVAAGCKLPTRYQFAGANAWAIFYSGIYEKTPNPEFNAIKAFNSVPH